MSCNILTNTGDILDNNGQIVVTLTPNLANYEKYNYLSNIKIECEDLNHAGHSYILEDIYGGVAIYPNTPLRRTIKITRPGFYKVKATMKFHKGFSTVTSNSATFSLACPDANRIQAILEPQFRAMWAQTLSTTREHGFYIYLIDGKKVNLPYKEFRTKAKPSEVIAKLNQYALENQKYIDSFIREYTALFVSG